MPSKYAAYSLSDLKMSVARKIKVQPQTKTFHATMLVTRVEDWWVEAESLDGAEALLARRSGSPCCDWRTCSRRTQCRARRRGYLATYSSVPTSSAYSVSVPLRSIPIIPIVPPPRERNSFNKRL